MSDYISREALIKAVEGNPYVTESVKSYVRCTAKNIPSADVVVVVRCRECRWWDKIEGTQVGYCHACKHGHWSNSWEISIRRTHKEDFYCADGERKDGCADNG